jgi:hypothetical protein
MIELYKYINKISEVEVMKIFSKKTLASFVLLCFSSSGYAVSITYSFSGQFDFIDNGAGGVIHGIPTLSSLSLTDAVKGTVTYDDAMVTVTGDTVIGLESLALQIGALTFNEADDIDYGFGPFPDAEFFDGTLNGIGFFTDYMDASGNFVWGLDVISNKFEFIDYNTGLVVANGTINLDSTLSSVPLPPAAWLFGTGIIGLVAVARRRSADASL